MPQRQPRRGRRYGSMTASCIQLRPEKKEYVWSYDMMAARTHDRRALRTLTILNEYTRECLSITVAPNITARDVIERLADWFIRRGIPEHIRLDNGQEFTAKAIREWLKDLGVKTLYIERGSPWLNGYIELFSGKLRDKFLNREIFTTLLEAQVLIENLAEGL